MVNSQTCSPRVSVILPFHNEERHLDRAVKSILAQTLADFELILLDDGSTDTSWSIANGYEDRRIRAVQLPKLGFTRALNRGLKMARAEYVARMDADDESLPERLQRQVNFLDSNQSVSVVGTAYYKHDALRDESYIRVHPETDAEIRRAMASYIPICHGSVMFRKSVVLKTNGYGETIRDIEDLELWVRGAAEFEFANLGLPPLYVYWFDPHKSHFERAFGRLRRVRQSLLLHARAIRAFKLPTWYYGWLIAKTVYYLALPNNCKTLARRLFTKSSEIEVTREESQSAPVSDSHLMVHSG